MLRRNGFGCWSKIKRIGFAGSQIVWHRRTSYAAARPLWINRSLNSIPVLPPFCAIKGPICCNQEFIEVRRSLPAYGKTDTCRDADIMTIYRKGFLDCAVQSACRGCGFICTANIALNNCKTHPLPSEPLCRLHEDVSRVFPPPP
jgi:hypothetical protein